MIRSVGERYYLKAMNCPHHHRIFAAEPRSYRDLPLRLAEYGTCYRYEQIGELFGLMRVRSLNMNDAHIYCTEEQFADEFNAVNEMYLKYFKIFGIEKYVMRFSTHDPAKLGQKFVDEPELWIKTEDMVRDVLSAAGSITSKCLTKPPFTARRSTCRSGARSAANSLSPPTRSISPCPPGSASSTRLAITPRRPRSASIARRSARTSVSSVSSSNITPATSRSGSRRNRSASSPIGDEAPLLEYANAIQANCARTKSAPSSTASNDHIKAKISAAEQMKVHTMLVIGDRDMEANAVSVRVHGKGNLGAKPRDEMIADLLGAITERRPSLPALIFSREARRHSSAKKYRLRTYHRRSPDRFLRSTIARAAGRFLRERLPPFPSENGALANRRVDHITLQIATFANKDFIPFADRDNHPASKKRDWPGKRSIRLPRLTPFGDCAICRTRMWK